MPLPIEDYALIGDTHTAGLVGRDGSIDWLCFPRFDAGACFAALLGGSEYGRWLLAPKGTIRGVRRRYRGDSLVLETEFETDTGVARVVDCMPHREHGTDDLADVARLVEGVRGHVRMQMELVIRFDYGSVVPWVRSLDHRLLAIAGPEALCLSSPIETRGEDLTTVAEFEVGEGDQIPFHLAWFRSHHDPPDPIDVPNAVEETRSWWQEWADGCIHAGEWRDAVVRSLVTLKALTYEPTGGIVAAATTSLPESLGGVRNWDYRYCWLRDATFTLDALLASGYEEEAVAWRDWLLRAVAGDPSDLQIMYGPAGERRLTEYEATWLPGYEGSAPVRVGNAAVEQFQLDVYGEIMDAMHRARVEGVDPVQHAWHIQQTLLEFLESAWAKPDEGLWEVRSERRHFTHSKVMAWLAFDRAVKGCERWDLDGPVDRWRGLRDQIHREVCQRGFDADRNSFVQTYDSSALDASLLMIPMVGFLAPDDGRVRGTVEAVKRDLVHDGFVRRYDPSAMDDGLPGGEGAFLLCTFWLAQTLAMIGDDREAREVFERLLDIRNDVGLLAEEYDVEHGRLLGNFPQAFSHTGLVNAARALAGESPMPERAEA